MYSKRAAKIPFECHRSFMWWHGDRCWTWQTSIWWTGHEYWKWVIFDSGFGLDVTDMGDSIICVVFGRDFVSDSIICVVFGRDFVSDFNVCVVFGTVLELLASKQNWRSAIFSKIVGYQPPTLLNIFDLGPFYLL